MQSLVHGSSLEVVSEVEGAAEHITAASAAQTSERWCFSSSIYREKRASSGIHAAARSCTRLPHNKRLLLILTDMKSILVSVQTLSGKVPNLTSMDPRPVNSQFHPNADGSCAVSVQGKEHRQGTWFVAGTCMVESTSTGDHYHRLA